MTYENNPNFKKPTVVRKMDDSISRDHGESSSQNNPLPLQPISMLLSNQKGRYESIDEAQYEGTAEVIDTTVPERCMTEEEFALAFRTSFRKTLRFLRSRGASEDLAEEVAQEAWARGWERRHQLRNPEVVDVWVASIAKHLWRNRVVRDQRSRELTDNIALSHNPNGKILWQQITSACGDEEQKLLNLHYVRGYTSGEIAERLGSTALAIRLRLMRTRRKLEQLFGRDLLFAGA
jgi:DNA-directed RNA polymerase specialized sigma24 family protein